MQKAEYQNRKKGMETGRTKEERSTGGTAVRGEREEGKRKNGRLSSQNRKKSGRKKAERKGKARKREHKGSTGGTAVGAKLGRMKGNKQEAEYLKTEGKHGKPGGTEVEEQGSRKAERHHLKSNCEAKQRTEKGNAEKLSTGIGRKAWKQARRKRKEAPKEPPSGENGKKGKERTES